MPAQTIRIYPGQDYDFSFGGEASVAWDGAGPTFDKVDDAAGAPDGVTGRFSAAFASARTGYAEYRGVGFPSYVDTIAAVRMYARFLANGNGGTFDVDVTGFVRPSGTGAGTTGSYFGATTTITSETASGRVFHDVLLHEWTADPSTSLAWTPAAAQAMTWGVRFEAPATDPVVNGAVELDGVYLEIDYVSIAENIDGVRANGTALLRLFRREPDLVEITLPAFAGDLQLLETFGLEHEKGPAPGGIGWGPETWRRALPIVLEKTYDLLAGTVRVLCLNPRQYLTRWWSTFLTDLGHSLDGQGIPLLHSGGGGITVSRAQVAYVERSGAPPDGLIQAAGEDRPKYSKDGLVVESAGYTNTVLNSTLSQGSGDTFDDWTPGTSSTGTVTQSLVGWQFDEDGLRRCALVQPGASAGEAYLLQTVSVAGPFRVRFRTKNSVGAGKLKAIIRRVSDGFDWNEDDEEFQSPTVRFEIGNDAGGFRDYHTKNIDPGGADDIQIIWGYFGESGSEGFAAFLGCAERYEGAKFIGTDLPTTTTSIARVEDVVTIKNNVGQRAWETEAGSFTLYVTPFWNGDDLDECEEKVFWCVRKGDGIVDEILFRRQGNECFGAENAIIFRRGDEEARKAFNPLAGERFKISARWVNEAGELGLQTRGFQVAVNDVWGDVATIGEAQELDPTSTIYVGSNGDDSWADSALAHADVSPLVVLDEELQRR